MSDQQFTIDGTITLADGTTSRFLFESEGNTYSEPSYQQWGANTERLGRSQPIVAALRHILFELEGETL